jgi:hypothetical protein
MMGLVNVLATDTVELLCGGRHQIYRQTLEDLLEKLSKVADLVFFEDGPVVNHKMETWLKRQNEKYLKSINIIEEIYRERPVREIARDVWDIPRITTYLSMIEETIKKFGELVVTVTKECDTELARYANNNPTVLAIFADDSDFLIFKGKWRYFSLSQLNLENLTTLEYDKIALRDFLGLDDRQMIVLSTLGGNDIINYDEVRGFHQYYCGHRADQKFPWLAGYIKESLPIQFYPLIESIAENVLQDNSQETKDRIKESFELYNTVKQRK